LKSFFIRAVVSFNEFEILSNQIFRKATFILTYINLNR
jgi:hypothetical protein